MTLHKYFVNKENLTLK